MRRDLRKNLNNLSLKEYKVAALSELDPNKNKNILLVGDSGTGKTCFSGTAPGKVHVCDFDGKISSLAGHLKVINPAALDRISYEQYLPRKAFPGHEGGTFNDDMGKLEKLAAEGKFPYDTIVIDSLTTMSDEVMKYLMKLNPGVKRTVTKGAQAPALQDYGLFRIFMKQMITSILSFPCNVIFTAHIERTKDEHTGRIIQTPMLTGKLSAELPIYFDEVYKTVIETDKDGKTTYMAQTKADKQFSCRTQIPGLPALIPLDFAELLK